MYVAMDKETLGSTTLDSTMVVLDTVSEHETRIWLTQERVFMIFGISISRYAAVALLPFYLCNRAGLSICCQSGEFG